MFALEYVDLETGISTVPSGLPTSFGVVVYGVSDSIMGTPPTRGL